MNLHFGNTLLRLRKEKGITQEELASQMGVTAAAVSKWEKNYTLPDILMLSALADYFDVSTDELLGRRKNLKNAVIVCPTPAMGQKMASLARNYGYVALKICEDFREATQIPGTDRILRCGTEPLRDEEMSCTSTKVIDTCCDQEEQMLELLEAVLQKL